MQPLLDPRTRRPITGPIILSEGDTKIVGLHLNGRLPEFVYIEGNPSEVVNCAPVVHLAHSIAYYNNNYDMLSVLKSNLNIKVGDTIFYQICALKQGYTSIEARLVRSLTQLIWWRILNPKS